MLWINEQIAYSAPTTVEPKYSCNDFYNCFRCSHNQNYCTQFVYKRSSTTQTIIVKKVMSNRHQPNVNKTDLFKVKRNANKRFIKLNKNYYG